MLPSLGGRCDEDILSVSCLWPDSRGAVTAVILHPWPHAKGALGVRNPTPPVRDVTGALQGPEPQERRLD
ncbi:hypothetical protein NDU88_009048 [Pleurodeles waltl]|uniref:Uncharacterized protein n=1 Tax=Pleurodeles waltl TaxID=8319 RepID=A0AAV7NXV2_PLEWA|nr:hypothetical protein NDU88_009048 [Pleurodeles waltl]